MNFSKQLVPLSIGSLLLSVLFTTNASAATLNWEKLYGGGFNKGSGMMTEDVGYFNGFFTGQWNDLSMRHSDGTIILGANPGSLKPNSFRSYLIKPDGKLKNTVMNSPVAFAETSDKGVLVIKDTSSFKTQNFTLVKYQNSNLKPMWAIPIKTTNAKNSLSTISTVAVSSNAYFAAGTEYVPGENWGIQPVLWKFDTKGKLLGTKVLAEVASDLQVNAVKVLADNTVITAGFKNNSQGSATAWIVALNQNQEKLWEKTYGCSEAASDITIMPDGNVAIASNVFTSYSTDPAIWNTATGRTFWSTRLTVLRSTDGEFMDERIIQGAFPTETLADLCSSTPVVPNNLIPSPVSFKTTALETTLDGGYMLVGTKSSNVAPIQPKSNHVWVRKLDANFNLAWEQEFASTDNQYGANVSEITLGKYLVSGVKQNGQRVLRMITE